MIINLLIALFGICLGAESEVPAFFQLDQQSPEQLSLSTFLPHGENWNVDAMYLSLPDGKLPNQISSPSLKITGVEVLDGELPHADSKVLAPQEPADIALYFDKPKKPLTDEHTIDLIFKDVPESVQRPNIDAYLSVSNNIEQRLLHAHFDGKAPQDNKVDSKDLPQTNKAASVKSSKAKNASEKKQSTIVPSCLIMRRSPLFEGGELTENDDCLFKVKKSGIHLILKRTDLDVNDDEDWHKVKQGDKEFWIYIGDVDSEVGEEEEDDDDVEEEEEDKEEEIAVEVEEDEDNLKEIKKENAKKMKKEKKNLKKSNLAPDVHKKSAKLSKLAKEEKKQNKKKVKAMKKLEKKNNKQKISVEPMHEKRKKEKESVAKRFKRIDNTNVDATSKLLIKKANDIFEESEIMNDNITIQLSHLVPLMSSDHVQNKKTEKFAYKIMQSPSKQIDPSRRQEKKVRKGYNIDVNYNNKNVHKPVEKSKVDKEIEAEKERESVVIISEIPDNKEVEEESDVKLNVTNVYNKKKTMYSNIPSQQQQQQQQRPIKQSVSPMKRSKTTLISNIDPNKVHSQNVQSQNNNNNRKQHHNHHHNANPRMRENVKKSSIRVNDYSNTVGSGNLANIRVTTKILPGLVHK